MLGWKTSQLLLLFQKSPAWIPSILHQGLGVPRVCISYRDLLWTPGAPGTMEPVGAPAFLPQGPQGAISWWVLPGLGAKPQATHLGNTSAMFALRHRSCPPLLSGSSARPRSRFHVRNMNFDVKFPLFLLGSASIVSCFTMVIQVLPPAGRTI